jgi:hypothetical protein
VATFVADASDFDSTIAVLVQTINLLFLMEIYNMHLIVPMALQMTKAWSVGSVFFFTVGMCSVHAPDILIWSQYSFLSFYSFQIIDFFIFCTICCTVGAREILDTCTLFSSAFVYLTINWSHLDIYGCSQYN